MASNVISVKLKLDDSQFSRDLETTNAKLQRWGRNAAIGVGAVATAGFAAYQAVQPLIQAASDLNEEVNKSAAIFGPAATAVQEFAESAATTAGLSERAALAFTGQFGQFGKAAGLAGDDLSAFGIELTTLAADLASFNNLNIDDAAGKLLSGLAGETEPLRQVGVFLNAAAVEAKALEMGLGGLSGELSDQDKILARYALIVEQTTDAQGDFARTSDGLANQQRTLAAQWENVQAELGEKLLPVMIEVVTWINTSLIPAISELADWLEVEVPRAIEETRKYWQPVFDSLRATVEGAFYAMSAIVNVFQGDWSEAWSDIRRVAGAFLDDVMAKFRLFRAVAANAVDKVADLFRGIGRRIRDAVGDLGNLLYGVGLSIFEGLWDGMKAGWNKVSGWLGGIGGKIKKLKGPPEQDAVLLEPIGGLIMGGLARGMERGFSLDVEPLLGQITHSIAMPAMPTGMGAAPVGFSGPQKIVVQLDSRTLLDALVDANAANGGVVEVRAGR